ncbi:S-adenosyl-L-methionine-dependent methyltransferase [Biscogniauxia mediterranea]|nr:S-adenosyl-L-methionine-dependent methyltransferase [Biscogniauxia mediterranea]
MAEGKPDNWSTEAYQNAASFVPKLATKIVQWLNPQPDDVILDIGCGDGVLNIQFNEILSRGSGSVHGIDASPAMIEAARAAAEKAGAEKCTFEVLDALSLATVPALQAGSFTKLFSNAALHWILGGSYSPIEARATATSFFRAARAALAPGGLFAFEMGGLGNVAEMRAAILGATARRVGLGRAERADPWFFPDEAWVRDVMEGKGEEGKGGWEVLRAEREWRPTRTADVDGWVRLFGKPFFQVLPEGPEREACIREAVGVLEVVCRDPRGGGFNIGYVRLRVLARRV